MKDLLFAIIHHLQVFTPLTKEKSFDFLAEVFEESKIYLLTENKQKEILKNILLYFDSLVCSLESKKKININISSLDILLHIEEKTCNLVTLSGMKFNLKK